MNVLREKKWIMKLIIVLTALVMVISAVLPFILV